MSYLYRLYQKNEIIETLESYAIACNANSKAVSNDLKRLILKIL